jgi:uncharacterized protein (DUF1800 family)
MEQTPRRQQGDDAIFASGFESTGGVAGADFAVEVLQRLAYGPAPGDVAAFEALAASPAARLQIWVDQQLAPAAIPDAACEARIAAADYTTLGKSRTQLWADHVLGAMNAWPQRYFPAAETECATLLRATCSRRQLYERMVEFWHGHLNVFGWEFGIAPMWVEYDRDVVRPHALGNFRSLLEAMAKSAAMLMYLDNASNTAAGFNENFARELLELHTLGAEHYYGVVSPPEVPVFEAHELPLGDPFVGEPKGYVDNDVYDAARCFTGWTLRDGRWPYTGENDGSYVYRPGNHARGTKYVVGLLLFDNIIAERDGRDVLDWLARHPSTARHVCRKLCVRFVADDPPQALVESAAAVFRQHWQAPDQIARTLRHIVLSPEFSASLGGKLKRPFEAFVSLLRAANADFSPQPFAAWSPYGELFNRLQLTGNSLFRWPTPDGPPDVARKWSSVSALGQSWKLFSRTPEWRQPDAGNDPPFLLPIHAETLAALPANQRSAESLVDYWVGRLVGRALAPARRTVLVDFMRQNAAPGDALDLVEDTITDGVPQRTGIWRGSDLKRHYSIARLRALVGLIAATPEFLQR